MRFLHMYLGTVMEIAPWQDLYEHPLHPYTRALLSAIPVPDPVVEANRPSAPIIGEVPSLINRPSGCVFHNRCPYATERCRKEFPPLQEVRPDHIVACFELEKLG